MIVLTNVTENEIILMGHLFRENGSGDESYQIPETDIYRWGNNDEVISQISIGNIKVYLNGTLITCINDALSLLKNLKTNEVETFPFSKKSLKDGPKIFRRKHGFAAIVTGESTASIYFDVPYTKCKINGVEIVNTKAGDTVNLKVYDTPDGLIQQSMGIPAESITPSLLLNQFGFDVEMPDGEYLDSCNYDADLIGNMRIEAEYTNNDSSDRRVGVNVKLHEVVES